jgi:hypothetical protein
MPTSTYSRTTTLCVRSMHLMTEGTTGREFAVTQTHWFRTRDGMIIEHWANRDDLAMARQAGWVPPSPMFLLRAAIAKRRAEKLSPGQV